MRRGLLLGSVMGVINGALAIALAWWFGRVPSDFGWYSYEPMPHQYGGDLPASSTPGWQIALVLLAAFLIVNTATATAVIYLRRRRGAPR